MSEVRVLIVDDQSLLRQGMAALLEGRCGISVVGQAANGREAVRKAAELDPDVILMDVRMPIMDGVSATRQICQANPEIRVVLLTMFPDDLSIAEGVEAGACGFLLKDIGPEDLAKAVCTARSGNAPLDPKMARQVLSDYSRMAHDGVTATLRGDGLSAREIEVLQCLAHSLSNKQIAADLGISEKTVKAHMHNIFRKLNVSDRTQAAVYAVTNGL